jgi:hypothetical protein
MKTFWLRRNAGYDLTDHVQGKWSCPESLPGRKLNSHARPQIKGYIGLGLEDNLCGFECFEKLGDCSEPGVTGGK